MPLGFQCLYEAKAAATERSKQHSVDIVAVHDVYEDSAEAWIHPQSGVSWLKDLLPFDIEIGRVVTYGYVAPALSFFSGDAPKNIQRMAESLVQELHANRQIAGTLQRPIIFVCHGLGGVVVKKSLIYSSTWTAPKVVHLWDQFISTFAVLAFGTPHSKTNYSNWVALERRATSGRAKRSIFHHGGITRTQVKADVQGPHLVDEEFAPFVKQFHMYFFWEELPTDLGDSVNFIVDPESAAPKIDNTEASGIHADHSSMVKFHSRDSSDYRTVAAALRKYCKKAPDIISHRWYQAETSLKQLRIGEAWELGGFEFDGHQEKSFRHRNTAAPRNFYPPQAVTSNFVGREDMIGTLRSAFLSDDFLHSTPGQKSFVVFGMGGSGKTQLCVKFANDFKSYYSAVFTIHATSKETIADSFCRIGKVADLEPTENAGRHFLSQITEPWLLIVDNADDRSLDLQSLFPASDAVRILVTTRCPDFRAEGSLGFLEMKGLREEEALMLLLSKADIPTPWDMETKEAGNTINKALGYLALAVIQAGNCIYRRICDLGDYLNLHTAARSSLHNRRTSAKETNDEDDDIIQAVYSSFDVSLVILEKRPTIKRQDASDLLNILCFFHFEHIPKELFTRAVASRAEGLTESTARSFTERLLNDILKRLEPPRPLPRFLQPQHEDLDKFRVNWAIGELQSLSLISFDGRYISLHPLVHAWARDSMSVSDRGVWASIALNTLMESVQLPPGSSTSTDGDFHRDVLPHLEVCLSAYGSPVSTSLERIGALQMRAAKFLQPTLFMIMRDQVQHAAKCGWVFAERGHFEKAATHLQTVRHILEKALGLKNERIMTSMLGLAGVYWGLGRLQEAIALQRAVVETRARLFGPDDERTLQAMDALGKSYWLHGMYKEALELQTVTSKRMRAAFDETHPRYAETLSAIDNLGVTLGSWRRYEESLELHREVLRSRQRLLGHAHQDTLMTKANLAMALLDLGRVDEAQLYMVEVYDHRRRQLGKEHPWTLWSLCYLAKVYIEAGYLKEVQDMLEWGVEAGVRSLTKNHLGVLMGRGELARVYVRQDRTEKAEALTVETVRLVEQSRGASHPDCVYGLWRLASLYVLMGEREKALETARVGLERVDMKLTREHPLGKDVEEMYRILADPSSSEDEMDTLKPAINCKKADNSSTDDGSDQGTAARVDQSSFRASAW